MLNDMATIIWKEWKEILLHAGGRSKIWPLIFVGVFGIILPLQMGRMWVETSLTLFWWLWMPLILVSTVIADSFAGERERHTLEALLASRLSDRAILFGKIAASAGYAWGMTLLALVISLIAVNIAHGEGSLLLYPPAVAVGGILLGLLMAILAASAGVLISLRAATVRQAQQTLGLIVMAMVWVPILGLNALPDAWKAAVGEFVKNADVTQAVAVAAAGLILLDLLLLAACMARFQRARLILD